MNKPQYKVSVIIREEEEGGFSVQCVELPSCISEGETREEAIKNIKEAIIGYLEAFPEDKELINKAREVVDLTVWKITINILEKGNKCSEEGRI